MTVTVPAALEPMLPLKLFTSDPPAIVSVPALDKPIAKVPAVVSVEFVFSERLLASAPPAPIVTLLEAAKLPPALMMLSAPPLLIFNSPDTAAMLLITVGALVEMITGLAPFGTWLGVIQLPALFQLLSIAPV